MTPINSIIIPPEFVKIAGDYYYGQDDKLYTVSSTGGLSIGTVRPQGCDTDEKWYLWLWFDLGVDVGAAALDCKNPEDRKVLEAFQTWTEEIYTRLAAEYGLEDWDALDTWEGENGIDDEL